MLFGANILFVLAAILPAFIFVFLFLLISKPVEFNFKTFFRSFLISTISVQLVLMSSMIFPNSTNFMSDNKVIALFLMAFVQVALVEEVCKFFAFRISFPKERDTIKPITIMLTSIIAAASFATLENILYLQKWLGFLKAAQVNPFLDTSEVAKKIWEMLGGRAIFAVSTHLFCGATIGYFTALGMTQKPNLKNVFSRLINKTRKTRSVVYSAYGVLLAIVIHGTYDFNIFLLKNEMITQSRAYKFIFVICGLGIIMIRQMILDLNRKNNESTDEIPQ